MLAGGFEKVALSELMNMMLQGILDLGVRTRHESTYGTCGFKLSKPFNALGLPSKSASARVSLSAPPQIACTILCPKLVLWTNPVHKVSGLKIEGDSVETILVEPIWKAFLYGPLPFAETKNAGPVPDARMIHDTDLPAFTDV